MAVNYPTSKDTWTRKVNRDLSIGQIGDELDEEDFNTWADWVEALQDTLGLLINGGYSSVADRLDDMPTNTKSLIFSLLGGR